MNSEIEITQTWIANLIATGFNGPDLDALRNVTPEPHHLNAAEAFVKARYRMVNPKPMIERVAKLYAQSQALHSIGVTHEMMTVANDYWTRVGPRGNVAPEKKVIGFLTRSGIEVEQVEETTNEEVINVKNDKPAVKLKAEKKSTGIEISRFSIVEKNGKFSVFLDGQDTGRYGFSRDKALEIIARKAKSGKVQIAEPVAAQPKPEPKPEPKVASKADKAEAPSAKDELARILKAAGFSAAEVAKALRAA